MDVERTPLCETASASESCPPSPFTKHVILVLFMAAFSSTAITSVEWTSLPYLRHARLASDADLSLYLLASAALDLAPVLLNPLLGRLVQYRGSAPTLGAALACVAAGAVVLFIGSTYMPPHAAAAADSHISRLFDTLRKALFLAGWALFAANNAVRILRAGLLAELVPVARRTTVLAVHQFTSPFGDAVGAALWLALQSSRVSLPLPRCGRVDGFGLVFAYVAVGAAAASFACFTLMRDAVAQAARLHGTETDAPTQEKAYGAVAERNTETDVPETQTGKNATSSGPAVPSQHSSSSPSIDRAGAMEGELDREGEREEKVTNAGAKNQTRTKQKRQQQCALDVNSIQAANLESRDRWTKVYVLGAMLVASRFTSFMTAVAFQPILVSTFDLTNVVLGQVYMGLSLFNLLPVAGMAALSRTLGDREMLLIGSLLKLVAGALFLPLLGAIKVVQVVVGFVLNEIASMFFSTAAISAITKCFGGRDFAATLGVVWSLSATFSAFVKIVFRDSVAAAIGQWSFGVFLVPGGGVLVALVTPRVWRITAEPKKC